MADRSNELRLEPVHFHFVGDIAEDGDGAQEIVLQDHGRKMNEDDSTVLEIDLFRIGIALLVAARRIRPVTDGLHPGPGRFTEQSTEHFQGLAKYPPSLKAQNFFSRGVDERYTVICAGDQHTVSNCFQDGLRAAGILLFAAEHTAQSLGLVTDQLVEVSIIDRHGHLSRNGFDQVQHFGAKEVWLAVIDQHGADHVLRHQQGHGDGAAMLS